ncbi:hydroxymethylglutaryl-CoA reductase [Neolewinella antarctica]|uniref:hydroxymethylglutaryl-CoA reductase (NADPH) n=1 Tax=Neolewinella antarctica TaxID=442734 RepID=A0ABX0X9T9_9BACT|nr:hydroxymethylglutaryl-CoA reductase [Neolewinella antarctica]NJC25776.1 hydroxymethylglutaryl-CoA reductase (NADPH) [Neolewinella antarctica]
MPNPTAKDLRGNIENFLGMARVPVGLAGPILMNGDHAKGEFNIPLATTEGALVASFSRGMKAITVAGGATVKVITEGVQRAPYFELVDLTTAVSFLTWVQQHHADFERITGEHSRYAKLTTISPTLEGNAVTLRISFTTGDAAGQNMVTICTDRICHYIAKHFPGEVTNWYLEVNASGDKKANYASFQSVRGKRVCAELVLPRKIVVDVLKTTPEKIDHFGRAACYGALQTGTIGVHAHLANGLAALFIACGQDAACVAEAAVGTVKMELTQAGDLYASITLPNLIVGTVGGGTGLPTQRECLEIMDCFGAGKANKFAEITAGVCLAGELSILAALSAGHFSSAHERLGRKAVAK